MNKYKKKKGINISNTIFFQAKVTYIIILEMLIFDEC